MNNQVIKKHKATSVSCAICSRSAFVTGLLLLVLSLFAFPAYANADDVSPLSFFSSDNYSETVSIPQANMDFELRGENPYDYPIFTFNFIAEKPTFPMPDGIETTTITKTLEGAGSVSFGSITFTKAGVYTYEIYQSPCDSPAWRYDEMRYQFKVVVTEQESGLNVTISLTDCSTEETCEKVQFTNIYAPSQAQKNEQYIETHSTDEQLKPDTPEELIEETVGPQLSNDESLSQPENTDNSTQNDTENDNLDSALTNDSKNEQIPKIGPIQSPLSPISSTGIFQNPNPKAEDPVLTATIVCIVVIVVSVSGIALMHKRRVKEQKKNE